MINGKEVFVISNTPINRRCWRVYQIYFLSAQHETITNLKN
jgi:hypothetical protein